jgi:predicted ATPase
MFKTLRLERFKNFKDAKLELGPFTVLVGANASGKSNIRDAFRFLHGIARGYNLIEIIGEKFSEGGERVWSGVRGGAREIAFSGEESFSLTCESTFPAQSIEHLTHRKRALETLRYHVEVELALKRSRASIHSELVDVLDYGRIVSSQVNDRKSQSVIMDLYPGRRPAETPCAFPRTIPVLGLLLNEVLTYPGSSLDRHIGESESNELSSVLFQLSQDFHESLMDYRSCRFFDWSLDALRQPCLPGQDILSDNGRNLSAVLHAICRHAASKKSLLSWIQELTPMDAIDFEFPVDPSGKILATLVERNKQKTTLASASDGTLRFLAFLAAFLGPNPSSFYFFEELENGIHPSRLALLLDLIEHQVKEKGIQVVATTHSPELLSRLSTLSLEHASLVFRLPDGPEARIVRVLELPEARRLLKNQKAATLFSAGWFETTAHFSEPKDNGLTRKPSSSKQARERAK